VLQSKVSSANHWNMKLLGQQMDCAGWTVDGADPLTHLGLTG
jgi:hypothetical protein